MRRARAAFALLLGGAVVASIALIGESAAVLHKQETRRAAMRASQPAPHSDEEELMPTLTSTVPCPRTGVAVTVNTPRGEMSKAEWIADHQETVALIQADCAEVTSPGGGGQ